MSSDYFQRFELAYAPFFVRKRVGKRFIVISRFRTHQRALDYLRFLSVKYPGIYFDIKDVSFSYLDKKSSL
ncbi:putative phage protein [Poophage MBI-2016a]|nr:putative phage protein [Poophage MBI-2016a]